MTDVRIQRANNGWIVTDSTNTWAYHRVLIFTELEEALKAVACAVGQFKVGEVQRVVIERKS